MRSSLAVILLSSMLVPAAAHAAEPSASVPAIRVTTGVVPPVVLNSNDFTVSADAMSTVLTLRPSVVLALTVNEEGRTENVRLVKSVNPKVDEQILNAARDFRFRPGMLDDQPVPVDLQLTVLVQR